MGSEEWFPSGSTAETAQCASGRERRPIQPSQALTTGGTSVLVLGRTSRGIILGMVVWWEQHSLKSNQKENWWKWEENQKLEKHLEANALMETGKWGPGDILERKACSTVGPQGQEGLCCPSSSSVYESGLRRPPRRSGADLEGQGKQEMLCGWSSGCPPLCDTASGPQTFRLPVGPPSAFPTPRLGSIGHSAHQSPRK